MGYSNGFQPCFFSEPPMTFFKNLSLKHYIKRTNFYNILPPTLWKIMDHHFSKLKSCRIFGMFGSPNRTKKWGTPGNLNMTVSQKERIVSHHFRNLCFCFRGCITRDDSLSMCAYMMRSLPFLPGQRYIHFLIKELYIQTIWRSPFKEGGWKTTFRLGMFAGAMIVFLRDYWCRWSFCPFFGRDTEVCLGFSCLHFPEKLKNSIAISNMWVIIYSNYIKLHLTINENSVICSGFLLLNVTYLPLKQTSNTCQWLWLCLFWNSSFWSNHSR